MQVNRKQKTIQEERKQETTQGLETGNNARKQATGNNTREQETENNTRKEETGNNTRIRNRKQCKETGYKGTGNRKQHKEWKQETKRTLYMNNLNKLLCTDKKDFLDKPPNSFFCSFWKKKLFLKFVGFGTIAILQEMQFCGCKY